ncbi:hypothetical protein NSQ77_04710 [Oceanobacillus sp. FSL K6-2867]|uniref:hypothetical protein n=1 Tax=Oceanobacillus sp. FSL K6-2867 TaxID=2954748 RepID=UPI0030D992B8
MAISAVTIALSLIFCNCFGIYFENEGIGWLVAGVGGAVFFGMVLFPWSIVLFLGRMVLFPWNMELYS